MEEKKKDIVTVDFYENQLAVIEKDGDSYVAMRPIVEGIGLDWASQSVKLHKHSKKFRCCEIAIPSNGGIQSALCVPLSKLNGYLFSINPEKVRGDIKEKVILYQEECFSVLHSYFVGGYSLNETMLIERPDKMREVAQRLRQLRTSEQSIYAQVREVFKETAIDYDSSSKMAQSFFAMAQDKFLYAINQKVAAELVLERANASKDNMGMAATGKKFPTKQDARIGKNYLTEDELFLLENISEQFLLFAETKSFRGQKMTMEELTFKLNTLLTANDYPVLYEYKTFLRDKANAHADREYDKWKQKQIEKSST